jgi:hypothetical protein
MNKKLTDLFDMPDELPKLAEAMARVEKQEEIEEQADIADTLAEIEQDEGVPFEQARNLIQTIHTAQDLSSQLRKLKGDTEHASTMDDVIENAFDAYKDLLELGFNIDPKHAGPIFAESTNLLRLVKEAANDKVDTYVKFPSWSRINRNWILSAAKWNSWKNGLITKQKVTRTWLKGTKEDMFLTATIYLKCLRITHSEYPNKINQLRDLD